VAGCCECGDEPSGSCATELVISGNLPAELPFAIEVCGFPLPLPSKKEPIIFLPFLEKNEI
jgi:hypothetical protein